MSLINNLKKQISIVKRLIRYYQILLAIENNKPRPTREEILKTIKYFSKKYQVNFDLAIRVAKCESGLDPFAIGLCPNNSIDRGLYQWNDQHHPGISDLDAFDYKKATELFCKAVKEGNLYWWRPSEHCWRK